MEISEAEGGRSVAGSHEAKKKRNILRGEIPDDAPKLSDVRVETGVSIQIESIPPKVIDIYTGGCAGDEELKFRSAKHAHKRAINDLVESTKKSKEKMSMAKITRQINKEWLRTCRRPSPEA